MTEQHPDPDGDGVARAAQVAAMAVSVAEALIRAQAQRNTRLAEADHRVAATALTTQQAEHATARLVWSPAMDDRWLRRADIDQLSAGWAAAMPWQNLDPEAARSRERIEERLAELHPDAMHRYTQARQAGTNPVHAMTEAAPLFAQAPSTAATDLAPGSAPAHEDGAVPQRPVRVIAGQAYPVPVPDAVAAAASSQHRAAARSTTPPQQAVAARSR